MSPPGEETGSLPELLDTGVESADPDKTKTARGQTHGMVTDQRTDVRVHEIRARTNCRLPC